MKQIEKKKPFLEEENKLAIGLAQLSNSHYNQAVIVVMNSAADYCGLIGLLRLLSNLNTKKSITYLHAQKTTNIFRSHINGQR